MPQQKTAAQSVRPRRGEIAHRDRLCRADWGLHYQASAKRRRALRGRNSLRDSRRARLQTRSNGRGSRRRPLPVPFSPHSTPSPGCFSSFVFFCPWVVSALCLKKSPQPSEAEGRGWRGLFRPRSGRLQACLIACNLRQLDALAANRTPAFLGGPAL
jgi:hypothetical protein